MRALVLLKAGGLEHVALADVPRPSPPGKGEVMVRLRSAALNRLDLFVVNGLPGTTLEFPHVLGSDGAGEVEAVGTGVSDFRSGDRVMLNPGVSCGICPACLGGEESLCAHFSVLGEHRGGTVTEYVVLPAENLARVPDGMPWDRAAAFSLATLTAWRMLTTRARLAAGETVLIWGIGGGVAMAALQVAVLLGARAIVTSRSDGSSPEVLEPMSSSIVWARKPGGGLSAHCAGEAAWSPAARQPAPTFRSTCGGSSGINGACSARRWAITASTQRSCALPIRESSGR